MQLDGAARNGETESRAAAGAVAIGADALERVKQARQRLFGHPASIVANAQKNGPFPRFKRYFNCAARGRVPYRVADHVLYRPAQQLGVALNFD